ncbi:OX-2 membrane glycoprotein-like [Cheilinus undulatus]|uniref:OX-2 membrane glycoprotein-like n=1 Tax=Cheilinus undulatus TaxID=241271 RepID=UPI001BD2D0ED|nr:OX-2 membrane glycoprotein-like [Cheilinus undulatus]
MTHSTFGHVFCMFVVSVRGLTSLIQTRRTETAAVGDQARLNCLLLRTKDVHEVTWQKISPGGERTVATDTKHYGQTIQPDFSHRVEFKDADLQNSSIVIREVTEEDEGCYCCLFNTYPDGALIATTCLQVLELHEPILSLRESNSTEEAIVSCSATGRPTPTVTITAPQQDLYFLHNHSVSVFNNDSTVTVTRTAVLSRLHENSTQVGCTAEVLSSPKKAVFIMLSEVRPMSDEDGSDEESGGKISGRGRTSAFIGLFISLIAVILAVVFIWHRLKKPTSRSHDILEMNETTQATVEDPHMDEASLQENPPVRL